MDALIILRDWLKTPGSHIVKSSITPDLLKELNNICDYNTLQYWYNNVRKFLINQIQKSGKIKKNNLQYFKYFYTGNKQIDFQNMKKYNNTYISVYEVCSFCLKLKHANNEILNYVNNIYNTIILLNNNYKFTKNRYDLFHKMNDLGLDNDIVKYTILPYV